MRTKKNFYLKLFLILISITFIFIYLMIIKIGRIEDIYVKDTAEIIIENDNNDDTTNDDNNDDDIYVYTDDGKNKTDRVSINKNATGLDNYYSYNQIIKDIDEKNNNQSIEDTDNKNYDFEINSEDFTWKEVNSLNIFNNEKFDNKKTIAPNSKGSYEFTIKNKSKNKVSYIIGFGSDYNFFVNMKYRLKKNGKYVIGNKNNYVDIKKLVLKENKVSAKTNNTYVLEWYWDSDKTDTIAGINGGYYSLKLLINTI